MEVIVTSKKDLQRIVDASVEAATAKVLARLKPSAAGPKAWLTNKETMAFLGLSKTSGIRLLMGGTEHKSNRRPRTYLQDVERPLRLQKYRRMDCRIISFSGMRFLSPLS